MSAFTFTAPIITPDDERRERAALPPDILQRYEQEIFGTDKEVHETQNMVQNGLLLIQGALDGIPLDEKQAYVEALERVPQLVERESPRIAFLRATHYDAWAGARRLVDYWTYRKKIFGEDRAFFP